MFVTEHKLHIRKTNLEALTKSDSSTHQHYSMQIFKGSQWSSEHQEYAASWNHANMQDKNIQLPDPTLQIQSLSDTQMRMSP